MEAAQTKLDLSKVANMPAGASVQASNGHFYVIRRSYRYDSVKKRGVEGKREVLGQIVDHVFYTKEEYRRLFQRGIVKRKEPKISDYSGIGLTQERLQSLTQEQISYISHAVVSGTVGAVPLLYHLALECHIKQDLDAAFGDEAFSRKILSIACYYIISGNNSSTHYRDFSGSHYLPWPNSLSSQEISSFLSDLGSSQQVVNKFFLLRAKRLSGRDVCLSIDSTSVSTSASRCSLSQIGRNKKDKFEPQTGLALVFNHATHEPLFYREIPGSVHDCRTMLELTTDMKHLGLNNECISSLDRGYCTVENIHIANASDLRCCMALTLHSQWSYQAVEAAMKQLEDPKTILDGGEVFGTTIELDVSDDRFTEHIWVHVYKCERTLYYERREFYRELETFEQLWDSKRGKVKVLLKQKIMKFFTASEESDGTIKLERNQKAVAEACKYCGYFANVTNYPCTAQESFSTYSLRRDIERVFRSGRQDINLNVLRTHGNLSSAGRLFVSYIALMVLEKAKRELAKERVKQLKRTQHVEIPAGKYNLDDVLACCKSIRYHRRPKTGEIFFLDPTEEQLMMAKAIGCEAVIQSAPEY